MLTGLPWPPQELDSLLIMLDSAATSTELQRKLAWNAANAYANLGRPSLAQAALRRYFPGDSNPGLPNYTLYFAEQDSTMAEDFFKRWDRPDSTLRRKLLEEACHVALSKLRRGDTSRVAEILSKVRPESGPSLAEFFPPGALPVGDRDKARQAICGDVLRGALAAVNHTDPKPLRRADSLMRVMPLTCCDHLNYDLGLAFARLGQYAMAAAAARRYWIQSSEPAGRLAVFLLGEGRWAALAGDTARAIKAYRQYLAWRENPEPVLVPVRDSARAELAALEKARLKPKPRPGTP
jgi:tetratricopeptide (TPR) repeat protein